jgi:hypothetical protein
MCRSGDHPSVIYLAGRYEDPARVEATLRQNSTCFASHVIVLSGDDLTVIEYPGTSQPPIPNQMTLYYAAQTDPAYVSPDGQDNGSDLNTNLQAALELAIGFADVRHGLNIFEVLPTADNGRQTVTLVHHVPTMPGKCSHNVAP